MDAMREKALQARIDELQTLLAMMRAEPAMLADTLGVTRTHARILSILRAASPDVVTAQTIEAALFGARKVSIKLIYVHISKLRQRLAPSGIEIGSVRGNKQPGWRLTPEAVWELDLLLEARLASKVGTSA